MELSTSCLLIHSMPPGSHFHEWSKTLASATMEFYCTWKVTADFQWIHGFVITWMGWNYPLMAMWICCPRFWWCLRLVVPRRCVDTSGTTHRAEAFDWMSLMDGMFCPCHDHIMNPVPRYNSCNTLLREPPPWSNQVSGTTHERTILTAFRSFLFLPACSFSHWKWMVPSFCLSPGSSTFFCCWGSHITWREQRSKRHLMAWPLDPQNNMDRSRAVRTICYAVPQSALSMSSTMICGIQYPDFAQSNHTVKILFGLSSEYGFL